MQKYQNTDLTTSPDIALGMFSYLNIQPVYYGILHNPLPNNITLVNGSPGQLNRAMLGRTIDVSCISSVTFAKHSDILKLIPHLSITANGRVDSVLLFSRYPRWRDLDGKNISITDHSATSVELLHILCKKRFHIKPNFTTMKQDVDTMLNMNDAALVIGDMALFEKSTQQVTKKKAPFIFDLAYEWKTWTGLPFVFGVWAAQSDKIDSVLQSDIIKQLYASKKEGLLHIDDIANEYSSHSKLPPAVISHYLRQMSYDLSDADLEGWKLFLEMAMPDFAWKAQVEQNIVNVL